MVFSKTHSCACASMSFSSIPAHSTDKSTVVELPTEAFREALSRRKAKDPAAAMKAWEA